MRKLLLLFLLTFCLSLFSQEETIESLTIKGAKKTKVSFIKKLIKTKEGQVFDSIQLNDDITLLKRLPAIANAYYKINNTNIEIFVEENFTIIPQLGIWTATNNRFAYRIGISEYNFLGRNICIGGYYQNNGYDTYKLNFIAPNLFSRKLGMELNHQNWKSEEPLYFDAGTANFLYNNISTELLGIYQLNFNHQITFGISLFEENYNYLSGVTDIEIPIDKELKFDKTLYKLLYNYDNLKYFFQYLEGFKSMLTLQYVTTKNNYQNRFLIAWNDFFYFRRFGKRGNWANRLRVGLSTNDDTPFAPFAIDNNINFRGVGILVDRGTGTIVYNTEYRHTLYEKKWFVLQGNVFCDTGSWRKAGEKLNDFVKNENIEFLTGIGLRFMNKKIYNAIFRIDYGHSLKGNSNGIVFGIGQYF